jgi:Uma2 family endonuclease
MPTRVRSSIRLTYEDYALFPDNGMIHELIDGEHLMSPAPETYHQKVSRRIQVQLYRQIEEAGNGEVIDAPVDVQLSWHDVVQPDLIVILKARLQIISPQKVLGPPDLVVEILSESSRSTDKTLKLALYEKAGVPEYWTVDPREHTVAKYHLEDGSYLPPQTCTDSIAFDGLAGVGVDLTRVW